MFRGGGVFSWTQCSVLDGQISNQISHSNLKSFQKIILAKSQISNPHTRPGCWRHHCCLLWFG